MSENTTLRKFYAFIILVFILGSIILALIIPELVMQGKDIVSYIGGLASILGLIIAGLEIIQLKNTTDEIHEATQKTKDSLFDLIDISRIENGISSIRLIRSEISGKQYGRASILITDLMKIYGDVFEKKYFENIASKHRINYDNIGKISDLIDICISSKSELSDVNRDSCFQWLTAISRELILINKDKMGKK